MAISNTLEGAGTHHTTALPESYSDHIRANASAVSWAAILLGAVVAAALSLILLMLGAGLGLSSISPWAHAGISKTGFGVSTITWVVATQILAAGMGGYLVGRLRTRWINVHADEAHFRDTVHGFTAWAVATLATAALLTSAIGSITTGATHAGAALAGGAASAAVAGAAAGTSGGSPSGADLDRHHGDNEPEGSQLGYFIDSLFRQDVTGPSPTKSVVASDSAAQNTASSAEVTRIFVNSINDDALPPADSSYVAQLVAQRTGLSQQDAQKRVNDAFGNLQASKKAAQVKAKEAADKLRKTTIYATLWLFASLLMGAFSASVAATWGGRSRDA